MRPKHGPDSGRVTGHSERADPDGHRLLGRSSFVRVADQPDGIACGNGKRDAASEG
jgi:hypothetical protein